MQVIIAGCGKVGTSLAHQLYELGHDVIAIDENGNNMAGLEDLDCLKIVGKTFDIEVQRKAGADSADAMICVNAEENVNVMTAEIAQVIFQVPKVLVRTVNLMNTQAFQEMGLDTICATEVIADEILYQLSVSEDVAHLRLFGQHVTVSRERVRPQLVDKSLNTVEELLNRCVMGVIRNGELVMSPKVNRLEENDELLIVILKEREKK